MSEYSDNDFSGSEKGGGDETGSTPPSPASTVGRAVQEVLRKGEYRSAQTKDGRAYWYHAETQEATWDLRRTLASKAAEAREAEQPDEQRVPSGNLDLNTTHSSILRRRVERQASSISARCTNSHSSLSTHEHEDSKTPAVSPIRPDVRTPPPAAAPQAAAAPASPVETIAVPVQVQVDTSQSQTADTSQSPDAVTTPARTLAQGDTAGAGGGVPDSSDFSDVDVRADLAHPPQLARALRAAALENTRRLSDSTQLPPREQTTPQEPARWAEEIAAQRSAGFHLEEATVEGIAGTASQPAPQQPLPGVREAPQLPAYPTPQQQLQQPAAPSDPGMLKHLMQAYHDVIVANAHSASEPRRSSAAAHQPLNASGVRERVGREPVDAMTQAFEQQAAASESVETDILNLVMGLMLKAPAAGAAGGGVHQPPPSSGFFETAVRASARPAWEETRRMERPVATHEVQSLERSRAPEEPERRTGGRTHAPPPAGGWGDGGFFQEQGSLRELCCANLDKYVVRRVVTARVAEKGLAERAILIDVLGSLLQLVQNQGNKNYPVASYYLQYRGLTEFRQLVFSVMHSLPFESVRESELSFRLEYWVTRTNLLEITAAVQAALKRVDAAIAATGADALSGAPPPPHASAEQREALVALRSDGRSMFRVRIVSAEGDPPAETDGAGGAAAEGNPFLSKQIMDSLAADVKVQGYSRTGKHLSTPLVHAFLTHALQDILLDDAVKSAVTAQALKKMGVPLRDPQEPLLRHALDTFTSGASNP